MYLDPQILFHTLLSTSTSFQSLIRKEQIFKRQKPNMRKIKYSKWEKNYHIKVGHDTSTGGKSPKSIHRSQRLTSFHSQESHKNN